MPTDDKSGRAGAGGEKERRAVTWPWTGNLRDDCTAKGAGLTLRAEMMDKAHWWWAVIDDATREDVASSNDTPPYHATTGILARAAAEAAAMMYLEGL